jgi:hypothetical protein
MRAALGLKARTGRAIVVAVAGTVEDPVFVERSEMKLLRDGTFAPYHAAEDLAPAAADPSVKRDIADAHRLAERGIRDALARVAAAGHDPRGCAVLVGPGLPPWSTQDILAVHVRMHQAEGVMFREVLVAGARACGVGLVTLREKSALEDAARKLGWTRAELDARITALGRSAGPPWGKDQKEAAAGALAALAGTRR